MLREALAAIREQDYPGRVETVVVFDQSDPDTDLVTEDALRPVRVVANDRSPGLAGARNCGILAVDTELIAFCDDDDTWLPGKLSAQVAALADEPAAQLVCTGIQVRYDDTTVDRTLPMRHVELADLLRSRLTELHPSTFLIRRAALVDGIGLVDEQIPGSYAEDYEFLLRSARSAPLLNLDQVLVSVRWHKQSYFASRWATICTALSWLLDHYPEFETVPHGQARVSGQIAFASAAAGDRRGAVRWAGRTLRSNPREARGYLALAVASGALSADRVMRQLQKHGKGL
ncbi:MAG: glycosyltransferase [Actinomycetota bacterium]|nr:glycosyltransferase [Actinomycetota bacterium]